MEQLNTFAKALIGDVDNQYVDNQQLVFPSLNIRLTNSGNKGFVPTTLKGNEVLDTSGITVETDFRINGACEYNGILYIAYTHTSGTSGLGTYPSLIEDAVPVPSTFAFERTFQPLMNYETGVKFETTGTDKLNFDPDEHVKMFAKPSYDGSVDLYIISENNPNRVINTGFNYDAEVTGRLVTAGMFDNLLNQIITINIQPYITLDGISLNGNLKPGNYFIFMRYLTSSFNRTQFCAPSLVIPIGDGPETTITKGLQEKRWDTDVNLNTNKSMLLEINQISTDFTYYEIGVMRFSSMNENAFASADIYLIDKYFEISNTRFSINGNEEQRILTSSELTELANIYSKSNAQTKVNDRYIGGNWSTKQSIDYDQLVKDYAIQCVIGERSVTPLSGKTLAELESDPDLGYQYNIINNIQSKVYYFPDEVYAIGMYMSFKNGYISKIYPLKGNDSPTASKGLYQFVYSNDPDTYMLSHELKITYADLAAVAGSLYSEIDGVYLVRTDGTNNLIYNGQLTGTGNYSNISAVDYFFNGISSESASVIPVIKPGVGVTNKLYTSMMPAGYRTSDTVYWYASYDMYAVPTKYALWSPDYLLGERNRFYDGQTVHMKKIGSIIAQGTALISATAGFPINPEYYGYDIDIANVTDEPISGLDTSKEVTIYGVEQFISKGPLNFSSYLMDGENEQTNSGFKTAAGVFNRSYKTLPYIGVVFDADPDEVGVHDEWEDWTRSLVSIYEIDPTILLASIFSTFNIESEKYIAISDKINPDILTASKIIYYGGGNCYNQKSFWRVINHFDYDENSHETAAGKLDHYGTDATPRYYMHGAMLGFTSLNRINAQIRNDVRSIGNEGQVYEYSWFPAVRKKKGFEEWLFWTIDESNVFEALQVNLGYSESLLKYGRLGYNQYELNNTDYKNRVFLSAKQESGSYIDNYRNISPTAYQDFNLVGGAIMSLHNYMGKVFAVQENAIIEIFVGEEKMQQSESGQFIIAKAEDLISDKFVIKAQFGAQNEKSIVETSTGVYGIDEKRKILWKVGYQSSEAGQFIGAENYGEKIGIQGELDKALLIYPENVDIVSSRADSFDGGVVAGYDPKEKEIHFTFNYISNIALLLVDSLSEVTAEDQTIGTNTEIKAYYDAEVLLDDTVVWKTHTFYLENHGMQNNGSFFIMYRYQPGGEQGEGYGTAVFSDNFISITALNIEEEPFHFTLNNVVIKKTIVISEKYQKSMGLRSYYPQSYFRLDTDMFTQYASTANQYKVYLHNHGKHNEFYGTDHVSRVAFIVNGTVSDQENYSVLEKIFESIGVRANIKPSQAFFFTDRQYSQYSYSIATIGLKPVLWKDEYMSPIPPSTIANRTQQLVGREMEGTSLKVMIEFGADNGVMNWIKSVRTKFNV